MAELTPQIATELMQRSMTTGVPTFELQQYGGLEAVKSAYERAGGGYDPSKFAAPAAPAATPSGISALPAATYTAPPAVTPAYDPTKLTSVESLYQTVLGRTPDVGGREFYKDIAQGGISPEEYQSFVAAAKPELDVQSLYRQYLGRGADPSGLEYWTREIASGGISPEERTKFYQAAVPEIVTSGYQNILGRGIAATDPGLAYYTEQLRSGALQPSDFRKALIGGATGADIVPAQRSDIFGSAQDLSNFEAKRTAIEREYGLPADSLKSDISPTALANKSLSEIQTAIRGSGANRFQEAYGLGNFAQQLYGLTDQQEKDLVSNLLKGRESNTALTNYYNELIGQNVRPETTQRIIADAAVKNPNSQYFKDNPQDLLYAKPAGEIKSAQDTAYTYGSDPKTGLPLIHAKAFNDILDKKGEVFIDSLQNDQEYENDLRSIGADPRSKYYGNIARGTGAYGVTASKGEISDFAKIEKELEKLGGIRTISTGDESGVGTIDVVYLPRKDPETGQVVQVPVSAQQFFNDQLGGDSEDLMSVSFPGQVFERQSAYDYYKNTKNQLDKIALNYVYKDPSKVPQYKDIKEAYDDLNKKTENTYLWRGRTDTWDPEVLKKLGIEDSTANDSHLTMFLEKKGDWLVPKTKREMVDGKVVETPAISSFKFSDPNTSSGFFGDIFNSVMEVLSLPPVAMALGAYLGAGPLASFSQSVGQSVVANLGLDAALANTLNYSQIAALENAIGSSIVRSGIGALPAGRGGDLGEFGEAFLSNLAGSGIQMGAGALGVDPTISRFLGAGASAALSDRDVEEVLSRLATSQGINALLQNVPTGDFDRSIMSAFMPSILSGKFTPSDAMRIIQAVNPPTK